MCATTGWHRNHARKALSQALTPRLVLPRAPRRPIYGAEIIAALAFCWAVLGAPTGKRLAPIMAELVPRLRRFQQLVITDDADVALLAMSQATMEPPAHAGPGQAARPGPVAHEARAVAEGLDPIRTCAEWNDAVPGFVELDLVGHEGGDRATAFTHRLVNGPSLEPVRTAVRRGRRADRRWACRCHPIWQRPSQWIRRDHCCPQGCGWDGAQ